METDVSNSGGPANKERCSIEDDNTGSGTSPVNSDNSKLLDTTPGIGELQCTGMIMDNVANNLEERLSKLETELNFMHDENDKLKVENKRQLDETRKSLEGKLLEMEKKLAQTLQEYGKKCEAFND